MAIDLVKLSPKDKSYSLLNSADQTLLLCSQAIDANQQITFLDFYATMANQVNFWTSLLYPVVLSTLI